MESDRIFFVSLAELSRRYALATGPQPRELLTTDSLTPFELRCFSQNGEDGVIAEILARIGVASRFFIEFGIESGREGNCVFLADVLGWHGLFMEPDPEQFTALERKYVQTPGVATLNQRVTPENVESLFAQADVPREPDVLSIDVDGQDYWIWSAITSVRPRVVVVEYNAALPSGRSLTQPRGYDAAWDGTDYFGASLEAYIALGQAKGYRLVHTDLAAINAFFVRRDLLGERFPAHAALRSEPNYFLIGYRHPQDPQGRPYTDLDDPAQPGAGSAQPAS